MKLDMLRTVRLSIIRSLFSVQSTGPGWNSVILVLLESCLQTCMTYTIAECTVCSKNFNLMIQINGSSVNKCGVFCKFRNYSQGRPLWFLAMGAGKKTGYISALIYYFITVSIAFVYTPIFSLLLRVKTELSCVKCMPSSFFSFVLSLTCVSTGNAMTTAQTVKLWPFVGG